MNIITENPYRTLGVYCGASTREIQKQISIIKRYAEIGKQAKLSTDFDFLGGVSRDTDNVLQAANKIEQAKNKVIYALFWFHNSNRIDETALDYLTKNEPDKAIEIWTKLIDIDNPEIKQKNFSAALNLSTLLIELGFRNKDISSFITGVKYKGMIISSEHIYEFVRLVAGENVVLNVDVISDELVTEILRAIDKSKVKINFSQLMEAFSRFPEKTVNNFKKKYTERPIQIIENGINSCQEQRKDYPEDANEYGEELYKESKPQLTFLATTLGKANIQFKSLANKVAEEILQCSIDYFNEHRDDDDFDPGEEALRLAKLAKSIAQPGAIITRINENLEAIQEWVDDAPEREQRQQVGPDIVFVTMKIKAFQDMSPSLANVENLMNSCKPKLVSIKAVLGSDNEMYRNISSGVAGNALGMMVAVVNSAQENPLARINPASLIDTFSKATSLMSQLAGFDMTSDLRRRFITNQETIKSINSQLASIRRQYSSTPSYSAPKTSSSSGGCYIATMAYGDYNHPQVIELRKYRDSVLSKSHMGKAFISFYYTTSPHLVKILHNNHLINQIIRKLLNKFIISIKNQ